MSHPGFFVLRPYKEKATIISDTFGMDIFKLIFEHDLRLDQLRERQLDRSEQEVTGSIEDFLRPDPTYSKFYITGTDMNGPYFGLNALQNYEQVISALETALEDFHVFAGKKLVQFNEALKNADFGEALILSVKEEVSRDSQKLRIDDGSNIGHKKPELAEFLA